VSSTGSSSKPITTSSGQGHKPIFLMSCLCHNKTFTGLTEEQIIDILVADTKINARDTTLAKMAKSCRQDNRTSSKVFGIVGISFFATITVLVVLADLTRLCK